MVSEFDTERGKMEKVQTTIRLPAELKEQLAQEASDRNLSLNSYILILIDIGRQRPPR